MTLVGAFEHGVGKVALGLVKAQDFLLDGVLRDEVIDGDVLSLADAVCTVGSLLFNGRIPLRVEVDNIVGTRQIQSQSTSFQADKEYRTLAVLELLHQLVALTHGY